MAGTTVASQVARLRLRGPAGPLQAGVHWPDRRSGAPAPALLVFFYVSRFGPGGIDRAEVLCRELCARTGVVVLSASYRMAPPGPCPAALHDATSIVDWAADHAADFDADPGRLLVVGEGACARLAAAIAVHVRNRGSPPITGQVLIYPHLDARQGVHLADGVLALLGDPATERMLADLRRTQRERTAPVTRTSGQ